MAEYGREVQEAASQAFKSPAALASTRLGRHVGGASSVSSSSSRSMATSRRSASVITSQDEANLFDQMSQATGVKVGGNKRKKNRVGELCASRSVEAAASMILQSFSMVSNEGRPPTGQIVVDSATSPANSHFSDDYNSTENYFSPGGALSIDSPGRVDEKDFARNRKARKHQPDLDVPTLDEKKTSEAGDEQVVPRTVNRQDYVAAAVVCPDPFGAAAAASPQVSASVKEEDHVEHAVLPDEKTAALLAPAPSATPEAVVEKEAIEVETVDTDDDAEDPLMVVETSSSSKPEDVGQTVSLRSAGEQPPVLQKQNSFDRLIAGTSRNEEIPATNMQSDFLKELGANVAAASQQSEGPAVDLLDLGASQPGDTAVVSSNVDFEPPRKPQVNFLDTNPSRSVDRAAMADPQMTQESRPMYADPYATTAARAFDSLGMDEFAGADRSGDIDYERESFFSIGSDPEQQERISRMVASLSTSLTNNDGGASQDVSVAEESEQGASTFTGNDAGAPQAVFVAVEEVEESELVRSTFTSTDAALLQDVSETEEEEESEQGEPILTNIDAIVEPDVSKAEEEEPEQGESVFTNNDAEVAPDVSKMEEKEEIEQGESVLTNNNTEVAPGVSKTEENEVSEQCESIVTNCEAEVAVVSKTEEDEPGPDVPSDCSECKSEVDLKVDDYQFHLVARKAIIFLESRIDDDKTFLRLLPGDRDLIDGVLPGEERLRFIDALRYRLSMTTTEPTNALELLILRCHELGLNAEAEKNPIIAAFVMGGQPLMLAVMTGTEPCLVDDDESSKPEIPSELAEDTTTQMSGLTGFEDSTEGAPVSNAGETQPARSDPFGAFASMVSGFQDAFLSAVDPTPDSVLDSRSVEVTKREASVAGDREQLASECVSVMDTHTTGAASKGNDRNVTPQNPFAPSSGPPFVVSGQSQLLDVSALDTSVGLKNDKATRHRLQAEIREASKLVVTSENPETGAFWRNHVIGLQRKLDALQKAASAANIQQSANGNIAGVPRDFLSGPLANEGDYRAMEDQPQGKDTDSSQMQPMEYDSRMVDVIAPADLPGGYHFEAEIEGQRFLATVPDGGVQQGETFTCYMRELNSVAIDIPVGYWKDGMCDMCTYGLCHPTLWHALFCPLVQLGQITHRLQLDFVGRPLFPGTEQMYTNRFMMLLVTGSWVSINLGLLYAANYKWMRAMEFTAADWASFAMVNLCMFAFTAFVTQSTRSSVREQFLIREERCYDLEDVMCATTCLPCTVAQMARHTANYDNYEAVCCSKTGLPDGVSVKHSSADMKENSQYLV